MKILFVYPEHRRRPYFPTAIGYLASAILEVQPETDIEVMDFNIEKNYRKLMDESFDYIFVSGLSAHFRSIEDIINFTKEHNKRSEVVLGGIVVTSLQEKIIQNTNADLYVIGEGERTVQELISGDSCDSIDGLAYRNAYGKIIINQRRELISNIDVIPFPAWHIFTKRYMKIYRETDNLWGDSFPVLASRGCPMRCNFCYRNFDGTFRSRSIDNVLNEIEILIKKYNINIISFLDEYFFVNKGKILAFCQAIKERKMKFKWGCAIRVELADKDLFETMRDAGCYVLGVGIESGSQKMLDNMNKKSTVELNERFLTVAQSSKMYVGANMIIGYPGETPETIKESENLLHQVRLPAGFHLVQAFPETPLWDYAIKHGYIKDEIEYLRNSWNSDEVLKINFTDMSTEFIEKEHQRLNSELSKLYEMNHGFDLLQKIELQIKYYLIQINRGNITGIQKKLKTDIKKLTKVLWK